MLDIVSILSKASSPLQGAWLAINNPIGWIVVGVFSFFLIREVYLDWLQTRWVGKIKFILLAINIPREHEQSPKAAEQIFAAFWGYRRAPDLFEKWIEGKFILPISLELVSIEGYVQFLIRLPESLRDLVESALYAQYPECEIIEVEDYVNNTPREWPHEGWDMWGTEFKLVKPDVYPLRTYPLFEHGLTQSFADPMAELLEVLSKIGSGEQIWIQWVITPSEDSWQNASRKEVKKLIGAKVDYGKSFVMQLLSPLASLFGQVGDIVSQGLGIGEVGASSAVEEKQQQRSEMLYLSPGERVVVEAIEQKASKIGYQTKMRFIYVGKKENIHKDRGAASIMGAFRQFSSLDANSLAPHKKTMTSAHYFFIKKRIQIRQAKLLKAFRFRSQIRGGGRGFILNIEELATLWHFPNADIRAPQVKRSEVKTVEPPIGLPVERILYNVEESAQVAAEFNDNTQDNSSDTQSGSAPPGNLPTA